METGRVDNTKAKQSHMFKNLSSLQLQHSKKLFQKICCHLKLLEVKLMHYFPKIGSSPFCFKSVFVNPSVLPIQTGEHEEIIDIMTYS